MFYRIQIQYRIIQKNTEAFHLLLYQRVIILILSSFSSLKLTLHNMLCNVNILCGYKVPRQILDDKIDDAEFLEFAITNFSEMMGYIVKGNLNIRIHRDITGKM